MTTNEMCLTALIAAFGVALYTMNLCWKSACKRADYWENEARTKEKIIMDQINQHKKEDNK